MQSSREHFEPFTNLCLAVGSSQREGKADAIAKQQNEFLNYLKKFDSNPKMLGEILGLKLADQKLVVFNMAASQLDTQSFVELLKRTPALVILNFLKNPMSNLNFILARHGQAALDAIYEVTKNEKQAGELMSLLVSVAFDAMRTAERTKDDKHFLTFLNACNADILSFIMAREPHNMKIYVDALEMLSLETHHLILDKLNILQKHHVLKGISSSQMEEAISINPRISEAKKNDLNKKINEAALVDDVIKIYPKHKRLFLSLMDAAYNLDSAYCKIWGNTMTKVLNHIVKIDDKDITPQERDLLHLRCGCCFYREYEKTAGVKEKNRSKEDPHKQAVDHWLEISSPVGIDPDINMMIGRELIGAGKKEKALNFLMQAKLDGHPEAVVFLQHITTDKLAVFSLLGSRETERKQQDEKSLEALASLPRKQMQILSDALVKLIPDFRSLLVSGNSKEQAQARRFLSGCETLLKLISQRNRDGIDHAINLMLADIPAISASSKKPLDRVMRNLQNAISHYKTDTAMRENVDPLGFAIFQQMQLLRGSMQRLEMLNATLTSLATLEQQMSELKEPERIPRTDETSVDAFMASDEALEKFQQKRDEYKHSMENLLKQSGIIMQYDSDHKIRDEVTANHAALQEAFKSLNDNMNIESITAFAQCIDNAIYNTQGRIDAVEMTAHHIRSLDDTELANQGETFPFIDELQKMKEVLEKIANMLSKSQKANRAGYGMS